MRLAHHWHRHPPCGPPHCALYRITDVCTPRLPPGMMPSPHPPYKSKWAPGTQKASHPRIVRPFWPPFVLVHSFDTIPRAGCGLIPYCLIPHDATRNDMHLLYSSLLLALAALGVKAAPSRAPLRRDATALSSDELAAFAPFTQFARAAYCPSDKIQGWQCGREFRVRFHPLVAQADREMGM